MSYLGEGSIDESAFPSLQAMKKDFGFIPNFFKAQTFRPDLIEAEARLADGILIDGGALSRKQKEYIFLVCSAANLSTYCVTAHCEIVRGLGLQGPEPERIAVDYAHADIPMADKALLRFAEKLNGRAGEFGARDVDVLRTYGFTDTMILEAVLTVGLAKFANLVATGLGTVPDFDSRKAEEVLAQKRLEAAHAAR